MIELRNVTKIYDAGGIGETVGVIDINLNIGNAGLVSFFGPSGCGKTTLLNLIGGLDKPTRGEVLIDGETVNDAYRLNHIGCIFQDFVLMESLTVAENVRLLDRSITDASINEVLSSLGIMGLRDRKAAKLSGGEKQRVCIARALVGKPAFLIADEPTGNLDASNRIGIMRILKSISKHTLVLLVSHEKDLVEEYSDRIIKLEDGRVISDSVESQAENDAFPKSPGRETVVPLRKTKRKRARVLSGFLASIAMVASCFAVGLASGKAEASDNLPQNVYHMSGPLKVEDRVALAPFAYFRNSLETLGLILGDSQISQHEFYGSVTLLPFDFYDGNADWPYEEDDVVITLGAAQSLIQNSYSLNGTSYRNLTLGQYGVTSPEDLVGMRFRNGYSIRKIIPGSENVGYVNPRSFYRENAWVNLGTVDEPIHLSFTCYSSLVFRRLTGIDVGDARIVVSSSHPLSSHGSVDIGGQHYSIKISAALDGFDEAVVPVYLSSYLRGESIASAYAWDNGSFRKLIGSYKKANAVSYYDIVLGRINQTKTVIAAVSGAVGLALLAATIYFHAIDLSLYFRENKDEYVVYRCLGVSRSRLYRRSLAGAVLGAIPPIAVGSVAGGLVVAFLCRNEQAALFLSLNIGTFAIGVIAALILVLLLCAVLLIGKFLPNAAEFKRINGQSQ